MKLARIFMAVLMFTAIVFRSLPDSVFNYFHSHTHINQQKTASPDGFHLQDYAHNCHIAEWNYTATEVSHSIQLTSSLTGVDQNPPVCFSEYVASSITDPGRAPPVA